MAMCMAKAHICFPRNARGLPILPLFNILFRFQKGGALWDEKLEQMSMPFVSQSHTWGTMTSTVMVQSARTSFFDPAACSSFVDA